MLNLDEMKQLWAELDRKLDESIRLNRQLLSATKLAGARSALQRMSAFLAVEAAVWSGIVLALGSFIYEEVALPRFAIPAVMLDVYSIGMLAATIRLLAAQRIDYGLPVAAIQKQMESLQVLRIRTTQWGVLAGVVVWAPFAIVVARAFFGMDTYSAAWLWVNVGFGLSLIPLALWFSKRFSERMDKSPFLQRLMRNLAGYNLNRATAFLAVLSDFEAEPTR